MQLAAANSQRELDARQRRVAWAELCFEMVEDVQRIMRNTESKFEQGRKYIGPERIEEALETLRSLESREVPAELLREILSVKRELAYTLTAVRNLNGNRLPTPEDRVLKAAARATTVDHAYKRIRGLLADFRANLAAVQN